MKLGDPGYLVLPDWSLPGGLRALPFAANAEDGEYAYGEFRGQAIRELSAGDPHDKLDTILPYWRHALLLAVNLVHAVAPTGEKRNDWLRWEHQHGYDGAGTDPFTNAHGGMPKSFDAQVENHASTHMTLHHAVAYAVRRGSGIQLDNGMDKAFFECINRNAVDRHVGGWADLLGEGLALPDHLPNRTYVVSRPSRERTKKTPSQGLSR